MDHVFVSSGLGSSLFSRLREGTDLLDGLLDKLGDGWDSEKYIWDDWEDALFAILRDKQRGRVILIGHSNGTKFTNNIAKALAKEGVKVHLLVAIDPTAGSFPAIDHNVLSTSEYWAATGWPALARRFRIGGALTYVKGWSGHRGGPFKMGGGHVELASNPLVHQDVVQLVAQAMARPA